jgi:hypothetical protein
VKSEMDKENKSPDDEIDFRCRRYKLPPEAFALRPDGPPPPPRDVVERDVWREIVWTPDDVSIRTSDDYGTELKAMTQLWGSVIDMCNKMDDPLFHAALDIADALQACTFNALCGYYRVAASCLRAGVECTVAGAYLQMEKDKAEAVRWQRGEVEIRFGAACDTLGSNAKVRVLEDYLRQEMDFSVFQQRTPHTDAGWARYLFSELSNFAHGRPTHSEGALWEGSNGPVFVPASFGRIYAHFLDTCALLYVLAKLGRPAMKAPAASHWIFNSRNVRPSLVSVCSFECLWGKGTYTKNVSSG